MGDTQTSEFVFGIADRCTDIGSSRGHCHGRALDEGTVGKGADPAGRVYRAKVLADRLADGVAATRWSGQVPMAGVE